MDIHSVLDLTALANLIVNTTLRCCYIMHQNTDPKIMMKEDNDPVTEIDYRIQNTIIKAIREVYPTLNIIGEEDLQNQQLKDCQIKGENVEQNKFNLIGLPDGLKDMGNVQIEDLCVWIDPLDCTRGFIANLKYQCTILIGVTYKQRPVLGIIGQPYKRIKNLDDYEFKPTVCVGSIKSSLKCAYQYCCFSNKWEVFYHQNKTSTNRPRIATSARRGNFLQQQLIERIKGIQIQAGGAGHKQLMVIRGEVDALVFLGVQTSKWDSCAGQAILRAMGGFTIQPNLISIDYNVGCDRTNIEGFICAKQITTFNKIVDFLKQHTY